MPVKELPAPTAHARSSRALTIAFRLQANALMLWDLEGPQGTLQCRAITTAYGYAFVLVLANEIIVWELLRSAEALANKAARVEAWLRGRGWRDPISPHTVH